jgi:hypothetical protein
MSPEPASSEQPSPVSRLFGILFLAAGVLIMGLSGLCSAGFLAAMLAQPSPGFSGLGMIPVVAIFGGIPFLLGLGSFLVGRLLFFGQRRKPPPPPDVDTFD